MNDSFYRSFEERYRGSPDLIRSRLSVYLGFVEPLIALYKPALALDLGCGRGEWLELLGERGFEAKGVDISESIIEECRKAGLSVEAAEAVSTLRALPDSSMALVSAFHLVEHLPFDTVFELIIQSERVLKPGGLLLLETPNPGNLVVGSSNFYRDPTHLKPLPSDLLGFIVEYCGFQRYKTVLLQELPEYHTAASTKLFSVLAGVSPDYGIVAQKSAPPDVMALFDIPFEREYGIGLEALAQGYDSQLEQDRAEVQACLARISGIETRLAQLEDMIHDLQSPHAGTGPVPGLFRRLYLAIKERRLGRAIRNRLKTALRLLGRFVLRRPFLKRTARRVLGHFPELYLRMNRLMKQNDNPHPVMRSDSRLAKDLSPRAMAAYSELEKARRLKNN